MTSLTALRQRHGMKLLLTLALSLPLLVQVAEPLPSWNDGPSKKNIIDVRPAIAHLWLYWV